MERMHGRTEPLGSATIAAVICCDAPALRPRRSIPCPVRVWSTDRRAAGEPPSFRVTFLEGMVWDVGRISSRLELWRVHHRARDRFTTDLRFTGSYPLRIRTRFADSALELPPMSAVLYGDERGALKRSPISIVSR